MDDLHQIELAEYLARRRKYLKLSVRGLARKAGMDMATFSRLENCQLRNPRVETLRSLATALEVPFFDLLTVAGFQTPFDLDAATRPIWAKLSALPVEASADADAYLQRLIDQHRIDLDGPTIDPQDLDLR
ncbi:hypothetical protein GCM10012320_08420 [Sinomonas cellulolyticus]|uniref:Helix-turn-helix domain-containing protein n=1 Tax=Sinomonas cellulolyticus TaxID=2801916 RepID=A0ABS1K5Y0_9MICC|nr:MULTISPECIES: helix-turn-helix transcriptional regulator [Sinomonas]MBL0706302.1 helix-turn-helix domain-containing protein [Sinomonas cellulolyticus]GHG43955.1 hypothetical protein GCM10012320_08420 [Sinomonas sp. KCTC 49339]